MTRRWHRSARALLAGVVLIQAAPVCAADAPKPYLTPAQRPDASRILPPPPPLGSPALTLDGEVFLRSRALKQQDPERWNLAIRDAQRDDDHLLGDFACALGLKPDRAAVPALYRLLDRAAADIRMQADAAKRAFRRARPYVHNHQPICVARFTPLDHSSSYPSSHATQGWMVALMLAELAPDRSDAILPRGRAYGESRVVCGVHWLSDVEAGMLNGAAIFAALHASPEFRDDLRQARGEIEAARARPAARPDPASCAVEQHAASRSLLTEPQP